MPNSATAPDWAGDRVLMGDALYASAGDSAPSPAEALAAGLGLALSAATTEQGCGDGDALCRHVLCCGCRDALS